MEGQRYIRFPKEVDQFLNSKFPTEAEEITLPLFTELSAEQEAQFRQHARDNYRPGDSINDLFHPIWQDEARRMNQETEQRKRDYQVGREE